MFVFINNVDPDEIPHYALFHLGFHCLPNNSVKFHKWPQSNQIYRYLISTCNLIPKDSFSAYLTIYSIVTHFGVFEISCI